ncbi:MAG: CDP-diacylglycerol--glycerol-3-phosphate 3-phosphatidyltransferase [Ignavibacteriales bacterium]|nr:MAG: CDP-diacylglycerol--glycerol-3-phosphate 3-phosphatidyltransferase [Ignavibacteriales bacterium]
MVLPNQLTVLRIILTPVFLFFFLYDDAVMNQISLLIFMVAAATDWYDGWLARKFNYITSWGKFWDPLADKILTSAAFAGFIVNGVLELWMVVIIIARDFIITGVRAYADYRNVPFPTSFYAKWKTFIQMTFLYYLLIVYTAAKIPAIYSGNENIFKYLLNEKLIYFLMLGITIITFHSGASYFIKHRKLIRKLFSSEN